LKIIRGNISRIINPFFKDRGGNFRAVLLCVFAATVFWFLNALGKVYSTRLSYPIKFEFTDPEAMAISKLPEVVEMNVSGSGWTLLRRNYWPIAKPLIYRLEDPLKTQFITSRRLQPVLSEQLKGLKINYMVKDTIPLIFDRKIKRKLSLALDSSTVRLLQPGQIFQVDISPDTVILEGPETLLEKIPDPLLLELSGQIRDGFNDEVEILKNLSSFVTMSKRRARVSFLILPPDSIPVKQTPE
jgi:hypothetical protein